MAFITFYNVNTTDQQRFQSLLADTEHHFEFVDGPLSHKNLNPKSQVIAIFVSDVVTREVLDHLPNLQLIVCRSTGFDHVDLKAAAEKGVAVATVPSYGENTVAEYAFGLLLDLSRKITLARQAVQAGDIDITALQGFDLHGKTFGIIGSGRIGQHAAHIARGFGMTVLAYDPYPNVDKAHEIGFDYVTLDELAARSDIISLHAPSTPGNHHLVDTDFLQKLRPSAVLINTARGELVDTVALAAALKQKALAGCALDVLEHEELLRASTPKQSGQQSSEVKGIAAAIATLKTLPQVIITPHNAFNTYEAIDRIRQTTAQNIIDFYQGKIPNKVEV